MCPNLSVGVFGRIGLEVSPSGRERSVDVRERREGVARCAHEGRDGFAFELQPGTEGGEGHHAILGNRGARRALGREARGQLRVGCEGSGALGLGGEVRSLVRRPHPHIGGNATIRRSG